MQIFLRKNAKNRIADNGDKNTARMKIIAELHICVGSYHFINKSGGA